ncbi:hypothetical protein AWB68_00188 [Caballeronia choica]|uniref:DUF2357 domain-containing protein n=1 Tax=Caballeronia choica TaxID=326476 RepID=A0A158F0V2_9BURK|nr:DUF2357 domain-containing protein [Caballeronia choica]SAL13467.1 hypothetical protein AWB68_00188 [Caballeronia choica]
MRPVFTAIASLYDSTNAIGARLRVAVLPRRQGSRQDTLWCSDDQSEPSCGISAIEVVEGNEYRYEWIGIDPSVSRLRADPEEIFQPDTMDGRSGRLRPGLATGTVQIELASESGVLGRLEIEVRSRKLNYASEYQWMLRDIAERMTELVMDRFAVSGTRFEQDETRDAVTLYQRFAFLRALIDSERFQNAIREILRRPHTAWDSNVEWVHPGVGLRAGSQVARQLMRAGSRLKWTDGPISSVPSRLERRRSEATHDTTPNRFIKFALEHWRQVMGDMDRRLAETSTPATLRGRREIAEVVIRLDDMLHHELFADLGPMMRFPADDQVLQKREGYRDVFKAYVEFELASRLSWQDAEGSHQAGIRDVATLYEHWAFIELAQMVAELIGHSFDLGPLVKTRKDGLSVVLQSGVETVLRGEVERLGRHMVVELCFNRTFGVSSKQIASWTRPMRPDYSLLIHAAESEQAGFEPVVIHFDAKYRVDFIEDLLGAADDPVDSMPTDAPNDDLRRGGALRADLLKMHAYRDAIRRTAGAYVLYPGGDDEVKGLPFTEFHELLPGLGAFVLRPGSDGTTSGASAVKRFLDEVLDHVATRLTRHERGRYWQEEIYGDRSRNPVLLEAPMPETNVLIGFVKGPEHWAWIERNKSYNVRVEGRAGGVRSDARLLQAQLLLLYCPSMVRLALARIVSDPECVACAGMKATGYPEPRGDYWCVQLTWIDRADWLIGFSSSALDAFVRRSGRLRGEPTVLSWAELRRLAEFEE